MNIKMYKTTNCGACKLVIGSGVVEELGIDIIDVTKNPELRPSEMMGAPFFVKEKLTEGGSVKTVTHTGFANYEMLKNL